MDGIATAPHTASLTNKKGPRAAASYRGARRNAARTSGGLAAWSKTCMMAIAANEKAHLAARQVQANGAREAAAKAAVFAAPGVPRHVAYASGMLGFYLGETRTRPVNRIIRELLKQVAGPRQ